MPLATSWIVIAWATPARAADVVDARCAALAQNDFATTRDAPFTITSVAVASEDAPSPYCKVEGYVAPEISFEVRLPLAGWNHGFVLAGSGGWANAKFTFLCKEPLAKGYACLAGDSGHSHGQGLWMQANPQTKIDWGYRATHVKGLAGKAVIQAFYGDPPKLSLMLGCSTSGYQGLVEAQRFPWDFAGIVAVAPDIDEGDLNMRTAWAARNFRGDDGRSLFATADLEVLHQAALRACDLSDGVSDGIIGDPVGCRFDPRTVACGGDRDMGCLSQRQVAAAIRIYAGPTTSTGERLSTAGPFPGSEQGWPDFLEDVKFSDGLFRFALADSPRDGVAAARFDFDEDYKRLGLLGTFVSSNPDLRRFQQAGGKLMIVQGGNDVTEQAHASIDYYQMVERVSGGRAATQQFARLFIVPGMNHCSGGDGAFAIDYLTAMERWAADGQAPAVLVGAHVSKGEPGSRGTLDGLTLPPVGARVTFTRPIFPYPSYAKYNGHGDVNAAQSFHATEGRETR